MGEAKRRKASLGADYGKVGNPAWERNVSRREARKKLVTILKDLKAKEEAAIKKFPVIAQEVTDSLRAAGSDGEKALSLLNQYLEMPIYRDIVGFQAFLALLDESSKESPQTGKSCCRD